MSQIVVEDAAWNRILEDPALARVRKGLSFHELRLIVNHVRAAASEAQDDRTASHMADNLERIAMECSGYEPSLSLMQRTVEEAAAEMRRLTAENERLSEAVINGILADLLKPDETTALYDFIKMLRAEHGPESV